MLTADQKAIRGLARDFAQAEIAPRAADWDRARAFGPGILDQLAELGFMGLAVPEKHGGLGLDLPTTLVALEELARADAALALAVAIQNCTVPLAVMRLGTPAQKDRWLPALASGEAVAGCALSPAHDSRDPLASPPTARPDNGAWTLAGKQSWVVNGASADAALVFAATGPNADPDAAPRSLGAFLVDPSSPGCAAGRRERTTGLRAAEAAAVSLDGARVPPNRLLGDPHSGLDGAREVASALRLALAALAAGIAHAALDHAAKYARERRQFGRPIAEFGAIAGKLGLMAAKIEAARSLIMESARRWELARMGGAGADGPGPRAWSAMAKLVASEAAAMATEEAVRIFGGYGFMREYPVEKLMRDAAATDVCGGGGAAMRLEVGRAVAG